MLTKCWCANQIMKYKRSRNSYCGKTIDTIGLYRGRQTLRTKYREHQDPDIFQLIFHIFPELLQLLPLHFWQQYSLPHISFQRYTRLVSDGPTTIVYLYTYLLYLLTNYYISAAAHNRMSRDKIVTQSNAKFISKRE